MSVFFGVIFSSIMVEGIITYVKQFCIEQKFNWQMLIGLILGIVVAVAYNLDLFELVGMASSLPLVGCILTGVIVSRGSNYVYDLIDLIAGVIEKQKT